jgi:hypothetical protein
MKSIELYKVLYYSRKRLDNFMLHVNLDASIVND